jgi:hypothetical protein
MPRVVVTGQVEDLVKWEEGFRTHGDLLTCPLLRYHFLC